MSALRAKAEIGTQPRDVRFVPKADSCTDPLDHFAGGCKRRLRDVQAKRFRGFQIYAQFKLGRPRPKA